MQQRFARYAWFVLLYNVAVVVWGAFVRASGSGAGCGEHWPLCNGVVIPRAAQIATLIEYSHRITSGLAGIFVILLAIFAFRAFPKGHVVRRASLWSVGFILSEGLIGAGLVLLGHVAHNASIARAYSLSTHLINTLFLLASLTLTAWFATEDRARVWTASKNLRGVLAFAAFGIVLVGVTGAIAALGDTLFIATSFREGWQQDFSPTAHPFLRLRILHPIFAAAFALLLMGIALHSATSRGIAPTAKQFANAVLGLSILQICLGLLNLALLAPVWMQLVHLLVADLLWIGFVLLSTELLTASAVPIAATAPLSPSPQLPGLIAG